MKRAAPLDLSVNDDNKRVKNDCPIDACASDVTTTTSSFYCDLLTLLPIETWKLIANKFCDLVWCEYALESKITRDDVFCYHFTGAFTSAFAVNIKDKPRGYFDRSCPYGIFPFSLKNICYPKDDNYFGEHRQFAETGERMKGSHHNIFNVQGPSALTKFTASKEYQRLKTVEERKSAVCTWMIHAPRVGTAYVLPIAKSWVSVTPCEQHCVGSLNAFVGITFRCKNSKMEGFRLFWDNLSCYVGSYAKTNDLIK